MPSYRLGKEESLFAFVMKSSLFCSVGGKGLSKMYGYCNTDI